LRRATVILIRRSPQGVDCSTSGEVLPAARPGRRDLYVMAFVHYRFSLMPTLGAWVHLPFVRVVGLLLVASFLGASSLFVLAADAPTGSVPVKERRLALVIGNSNYPFAPLRNSLNDARDFAAALKDSGFEVTILENAKLRDTRNALRDFGDRLKAQGGVGLFYYAGHGMQVKGRTTSSPSRPRSNVRTRSSSRASTPIRYWRNSTPPATASTS